MLFDIQYGLLTLASATPQRPLTHDNPTTPLQTVMNTFISPNGNNTTVNAGFIELFTHRFLKLL